MMNRESSDNGLFHWREEKRIGSGYGWRTSSSSLVIGSQINEIEMKEYRVPLIDIDGARERYMKRHGIEEENNEGNLLREEEMIEEEDEGVSLGPMVGSIIVAIIAFGVSMFGLEFKEEVSNRWTESVV
jgi:hypothetical protein